MIKRTIFFTVMATGAAQAQSSEAHLFFQSTPPPVQFVATGRPVNITPPPFIRGRLVCAVNVNRFLAKLGKPTTGSALAHSFLRYGRPATPNTPGAVQVERRRGGGHVKIVAGGGYCWNPSASRQTWTLVPCGGRNVIAWRIS